MFGFASPLVETLPIVVARGVSSLDPLFVLAVLGFVVFSWLLSRLLARDRRYRWEVQAEELGLAFEAKDDGSLLQSLNNASIQFLLRASDLSYVLTGTVEGEAVTLFEAHLRHSQHGGRVAYLMVDVGPSLPAFDLRLESPLGRIRQAFGARDINFETHPTFSDAYGLRAEDEDAVRRVFSPSLLDYFVNAEYDLTVESFDGRLLICRNYRKIEPAEARAFLDDGLEIVRLMRAADKAPVDAETDAVGAVEASMPSSRPTD